MCNIDWKAEFIKKFVTKVCFLFSTCVDEALLCKGIPLCENKNDLKACKMNLPDMDWIQIASLFTCTPIDHPEYVMPFGQTIDIYFKADDSQFYCLNRGDKNPFSITNSGSNGTNSKTWTQLVNTACEYKRERRCLGSRPDRCADAIGKYLRPEIYSGILI